MRNAEVQIFCGWGDGPDVGINLTRSLDNPSGWLADSRDGQAWCYIDLTADEAESWAAQLLAAAALAKEMDKLCAEHDKEQP